LLMLIYVFVLVLGKRLVVDVAVSKIIGDTLIAMMLTRHTELYSFPGSILYLRGSCSV